MSTAIESNLILKSRIEKPEGDGFKETESGLQRILSLIEKINAMPVIVTVTMKGDVKAVDSLKNFVDAHVATMERRAQAAAKARAAKAERQQKEKEAAMAAGAAELDALQRKHNAVYPVPALIKKQYPPPVLKYPPQQQPQTPDVIISGRSGSGQIVPLPAGSLANPPGGNIITPGGAIGQRGGSGGGGGGRRGGGGGSGDLSDSYIVQGPPVSMRAVTTPDDEGGYKTSVTAKTSEVTGAARNTSQVTRDRESGFVEKIIQDTVDIRLDEELKQREASVREKVKSPHRLERLMESRQSELASRSARIEEWASQRQAEGWNVSRQRRDILLSEKDPQRRTVGMDDATATRTLADGSEEVIKWTANKKEANNVQRVATEASRAHERQQARESEATRKYNELLQNKIKIRKILSGITNTRENVNEYLVSRKSKYQSGLDLINQKELENKELEKRKSKYQESLSNLEKRKKETDKYGVRLMPLEEDATEREKDLYSKRKQHLNKSRDKLLDKIQKHKDVISLIKKEIESNEKQFISKKDAYVKSIENVDRNIEKNLKDTKNFGNLTSEKISGHRLVPGVDRFADYNVHRVTKQNNDGTEEVAILDERTGKTHAYTNRNTKAAQEAAKHQEILNNTQKAGAITADLISQGYQKASSEIKTFDLNGQKVTTTIETLQRVSGSALKGNLAVEVAKVNSATGELTQNTLTASKAVRYLGDSFGSAIRKVTMWFSATSAVFLMTKAVRDTVAEFKELEANTVFLARVGKNLGDGFNQRYEEAKRLTMGIAELSSATGVSATESQKAAAIFLRAGQNRVEALNSVKVAMLASSIAELEVEESSKLLAAAQAQFNLNSTQLLPTLDSLNTLSNRYVVTTNDLFQSISRAGKVFSESGGSLEELAGVVAVTSERTRRSGTEIGNAIKTIQSRLVSPEVSGNLLQKIGLSMYDAEGQAKSYTKILLQMRTALVGMSNAQKDSILVNVAGARQINILKTHIDGAADSILAQVEALRGQGSATDEALEKLNTLESAVNRFKGAFSDIVSSQSGAGESIEVIVSAFAGLLKVMNIADGLLIKFGLLTLAIATLTYLVSRFGQAVLTSTLAVTSFSTALLGSAASSGILSTALMFLHRHLLILNALIASNPMLALAIGLGIAITAIGSMIGIFSYLDKSWSRQAIEAKIAADAFKENANAADRERQAINSLSYAIAELFEERKRLNDLEKKGKDVKKEKDRNEKEIIALAEKAGVAVNQAIPLDEQEEEIRNKVRDIRRKAIQQQISDNGVLAVETKRQLEQIKHDISDMDRAIELQKKFDDGTATVKDMLEVQKRKGRVFEIAKENNVEFDASSPKARMYSLELIRAKLRSKAAQQKGELAKTEDQNKDLRKTLENDPETWNDAQKKLKDVGEAASLAFDSFQRLNSEFNRFVMLTESIETVNTEKKLKDLTKIQEDLLNSTEGLPDGVLKSSLAKQLGKVSDERRGVLLDQTANYINIRKQQESSRGDISTGINKEFSIHNAMLPFHRNPLAFGGSAFESFDQTRAEKDFYMRNARDTELQREANQFSFNAGGMSQENFIAKEAATQDALVENLNNARDAEIQSAKELLSIEKQLTVERINQNKEAMRAAGLLSDEDKVKLLMQAQYFRENPNKQISQEERFFMDSGNVALTDQFFGSRIQEEDEQAGAENFLGEDVGISAELKESERRLAEEMGFDPNDPVSREEARERLRQRTQQEALALEDQADQVRGRDINGLAGQAPQINLDLQNPMRAEDFQPMIDAFERTIQASVVQARGELIDRITKVEQRVADALKQGREVADAAAPLEE